MNLLFNKNTLDKKPYFIQEINDPNFIKLNNGEWLFPVCDEVNTILQNSYNRNNCAFYNTRNESYYSLLENIRKYNNIEDINNILLTNGSDNALRLICNVFLTPESKVLLPIPTYPHFKQMLSISTCKTIDTVNINYKMNESQIEQVFEEKLKENYHLTYIVRPNMPLGYSLSYDFIEKILKTNKDTLFIIDEAYLEFSHKKTVSPLIHKYNNLIVVRTFSKFFSLASLRLGYLMTNKFIMDLIQPYHNLKDLTKIALEAANISLNNLDHYEHNRREYFQVKHYLMNELKILREKNHILDYKINDNMFFLIFVNDPSGFCEYLKKNYKIIARDKSDEIPNCIRVSISTLPFMMLFISAIKLHPNSSSD